MKLFQIILGIFLVLCGLWGGSLLLHFFTADSDFVFASIFTGLIIALGGGLLVVKGSGGFDV